MLNFYNRKIHLAFLAFILLLTITLLNAQDGGPSTGTASGILLRFDPAPRVTGLSGAFTALADDEQALYYNPGALAILNRGIIALNHSEWLEDIRIENLTFAYPINSRFGIGAGITHLWLPEIPGYDENGQTTSGISVSSTIFALGGAYAINHNISVGVGLKLLQDKLAEFSATGFAGDLGIHGRFMRNRLLVGLTAQNIGGKLTYETEQQDLPITFRGGFAWRFLKPDLNLSLDVIKPKDTDLQVAFGVEYVYDELIALRVGNRYTSYEAFTPSVGLGVIVRDQYRLNYTFVSLPELSGTHRIGFSFYFGKPITQKLPKPIYDSSKPVTLVPPSDLIASIMDGELHVTWSIVAGVQYNVYARHNSQKNWVKLNKTPIYNNKMKFKKPLTFGLYHFRVSSVDGTRESSFSKEVTLDVK